MRLQTYRHIQKITAIGVILAGIFFSYHLTGAQEQVWICPSAPIGEYSNEFDCNNVCRLQFNEFCFPQDAIGTPVPPEDSTSVPDLPKLEIYNPLGDIDSFSGLAEAIFRWIVIIAIPLTVIFLIWAGLLFVTSRGDEQQLAKAKKVFFWAVIGAMVIVASWVIAVAIHNSAQTL